MRTTIELPETLRARLQSLAVRRGQRGLSTIVREAVEHYLDGEDDRRWDAEETRAVMGALNEQDARDLQALQRRLARRWL
jgi:predicted DNA-binding protein